jgi:hypothetical protein
LAACRVAAPLVTHQCQPRLAQEARGRAGEQALTTRASPRGINAWVGPIQGQRLCPVNPCPARLRGRHGRPPCGTWPDGDAGQLGWGCRGAAGRRTEGSQGWVRREGTERLAQTPRGIPLRERGAGDLEGRLRHDLTGQRGQAQRKSPRVGVASIGDATPHPSNQTGDGRRGIESFPARPPSGFASDILTTGGLPRNSSPCGSGDHPGTWGRSLPLRGHAVA